MTDKEKEFFEEQKILNKYKEKFGMPCLSLYIEQAIHLTIQDGRTQALKEVNKVIEVKE